jgi:hypothetical protein
LIFLADLLVVISSLLLTQDTVRAFMGMVTLSVFLNWRGMIFMSSDTDDLLPIASNIGDLHHRGSAISVIFTVLSILSQTQLYFDTADKKLIQTPVIFTILLKTLMIFVIFFTRRDLRHLPSETVDLFSFVIFL